MILWFEIRPGRIFYVNVTDFQGNQQFILPAQYSLKYIAPKLAWFLQAIWKTP